MSINTQELLDAGCHFGHLKRKWNPKMAPYIFMERNGIHIIDLNKTSAKLDEAASAIKQIAKSGKRVLFVATKKQAKEIVANAAKSVGMPYITERWPGGMLTNFATQRKSVKKMTGFDRFMKDETFNNISKKERLQVTRQKAKMEKLIGSIADLTRLPAALFIVDVLKEHIAVSEAQKLGIPTIAICDTNTDPSPIDFPIPANDDATKSISLIMGVMVKAIEEGLEERKMDKEADREREAAAEDESGERTEGEKEYAVADDADDSGETKTKAPAKKAGTRSRRPTTRKKSED
ncbi:MAG TPA: 30S ribosomal protein S2 [Bacteroidia bacterium]|nr:MAG: 30S ribosomal protein S2 [Bacteroidetes bacterium OLB10]MBE7508609.1 30S ribosomal protein S2 [Bacteroidia bacterium]MBX3105791.1 30S ribosomal protein S2 [Bacteroidota bacterium]MCE7955290.1 30S ribosomal protein S2 [Bacteroidetes bacterium CHB6]OQB63550.1 MAG: 30S ribosomal protein S2 [Bacteroidetes bacterium ADurb.Bin141]